MEMKEVSPGYYSILRWRKDPLRDESKNVAIVLIDVHQESGYLKVAPLSSISSRLHEQGLLDQMLVGLEKQVQQSGGFTLESLKELHGSLRSSLSLTEPRTAIIPSGNPEDVMQALYKAYVAPETGGSNVLSKGRVLDKVVNTLRKYKQSVKRGAYIRDYIFDVILESPKKPKVLEVLSFATSAKNWIPVEHEVGYFLRAIDQLAKSGMAVIQPPTSESDSKADESHHRVLRLLRKDKIPIIRPDELVESLALDPQLAMST